MKMSRKAVLAGGLVGVVAAIVLMTLRSDQGEQSIEGIWMSRFYCGCLCDSHNFFLFEEGRIVRYSDAHQTDYSAGFYEEISAGLYRVTMVNDILMNESWEVRPGSNSWVAPPDRNQSWLQRRVRRFYRPWDPARERELIASAPARDESIRAEMASE